MRGIMPSEVPADVMNPKRDGKLSEVRVIPKDFIEKEPQNSCLSNLNFLINI